MSGEGLSQKGADFQLQPVPASKRKRNAANNERPRVLQPHQHPSRPLPPLLRPTRLRRSQSLPSLRAKPSVDLSLPASHTISVPDQMKQSWSTSRNWQASQGIAARQLVKCVQDQAMAATEVLQQTAILSAASSSSSSFLALPSTNTLTMVSPTISSQSSSVYTPPIAPPVNSQTLRELDLHEILKNPQLRHDLVFDSDLQFRPNFDGDRGKRKREICNKYWRAVQREIETRCSCTSFYGSVELPCVCAAARRRGSGPTLEAASDTTFYTRIPSLIAELRCICLSILPIAPVKSGLFAEALARNSIALGLTRPAFSVNGTQTSTQQQRSSLTAQNPTRREPYTAAPHIGEGAKPSLVAAQMSANAFASDEHFILIQCLDPIFLMQQLSHGVLDIVALITTIGTVLKKHCAPMRDDLIDEMIKTVEKTGDVTRSLRQCFDILELMKLDVANHQLSASRIYLVDSAAEFEARWFREQLCKGKASLQKTAFWLRPLLLQSEGERNETQTEKMSAAFDKGVLDLIFNPPSPVQAITTQPSSPATIAMLGNTASQSIYASAFPETLQFDVHRLLTFSGEVNDVIIVSVMLLLFRQLACSPQNLSSTPFPHADKPAPSAARLSALASTQQEEVKGELWSLLRDAEATLSAERSNSAMSSPPASPGGVAGRVLDSRLSSWHRVIDDVVLQIASRAIGVQVQVRRQMYAADVSSLQTQQNFVPSTATISLLGRWLVTNLQPDSSVFLLCQRRVREILARLTNSKSIANLGPFSSTDAGPSRRKRAYNEVAPNAPMGKRVKLHFTAGSVRAQSISTSESYGDASGLETFSAEIDLLADRINRVKKFHLLVYRPHYEAIAMCQSKLSPTASITTSQSQVARPSHGVKPQKQP